MKSISAKPAIVLSLILLCGFTSIVVQSGTLNVELMLTGLNVAIVVQLIVRIRSDFALSRYTAVVGSKEFGDGGVCLHIWIICLSGIAAGSSLRPAW